MKHPFLRSVCRAMIGVVLLAQLAVSAYACPGLSTAAVAMKMPMSAAVPSGADPTEAVSVVTAAPQPINCEDMAGPMDPEFANLCAAHCHHGQQSDQTATLAVPAALLTAFYITPLAPEPSVAPRPAAAAPSARSAAFPPLAILHCCFRV